MNKNYYKNKNIVPYLFITPWIIGFLMFFAFPVVYSLVLSLGSSGIMGNYDFVGLQNYKDILFEDKDFWLAISITFKYALILVPLNMMISLSLAILLNKNIKGSSFFKVAYYLPSVLSGVVLAIIWGWILSNNGILNYILGIFGIENIKWLDSKNTALFSVILTTLWSNGTLMLVFLGGLKNIDKSYYEAAQIDGASKIKVFLRITLPLLSPTILFNSIMAIIAAFQQITVVMNLTGQGPNKSTLMYSLYVYQKAFQEFKFGYAAALAWVMFLFVSVITFGIMKWSKKWTYYEI